MHAIKSISYRRILNSHVDFTNEFIVELENGSRGEGGAPQGETISIYEDRAAVNDPAAIIDTIENDGMTGVELDQAGFDEYLRKKISAFGRNNAFALSLSFFNASKAGRPVFELFGKDERRLVPPAICFNILNGGYHAYTNPVLCDFSELMLVSRGRVIEEIIEDHNRIQEKVREGLAVKEKTLIGGNPVNRFATADNRECIDFLLGIRDGLGLAPRYDLMIDASAGDLWTGEGYKLGLTDGAVRDSDEFHSYWMDLIGEYKIGYLEDPFREEDFESWNRLTTGQQGCAVIGDNLYSTDPERIQEGADRKYSHGTVVKPNQAGTVTAVRRAIETAQRNGLVVITSHRSISTESVFLATLTCMYGVELIKIGPLCTDFSSVVRLNEIIRLTEE